MLLTIEDNSEMFADPAPIVWFNGLSLNEQVILFHGADLHSDLCLANFITNKYLNQVCGS